MALNFKMELARVSSSGPILLCAAVLGLQGCSGITFTNAPYVAGVSFIDKSQEPNVYCDGLDAALRAQCTPELLESLKFAEIGKTIGVVPVMGGSGNCEAVSVDFGDGTPPARLSYFDVNSNVRAPHSYNGWPGQKLVRVKGDGSCGGNVKKEITVGFAHGGRTNFILGFVPNSQICNSPTPSTALHLLRLLRGRLPHRSHRSGRQL